MPFIQEAQMTQQGKFSPDIATPEHVRLLPANLEQNDLPLDTVFAVHPP